MSKKIISIISICIIILSCLSFSAFADGSENLTFNYYVVTSSHGESVPLYYVTGANNDIYHFSATQTFDRNTSVTFESEFVLNNYLETDYTSVAFTVNVYSGSAYQPISSADFKFGGLDGYNLDYTISGNNVYFSSGLNRGNTYYFSVTFPTSSTTSSYTIVCDAFDFTQSGGSTKAEIEKYAPPDTSAIEESDAVEDEILSPIQDDAERATENFNNSFKLFIDNNSDDVRVCSSIFNKFVPSNSWLETLLVLSFAIGFLPFVLNFLFKLGGKK